ncbi:MAG: single-stranded DNA-binding protein [Arachidicoccus sp.]|nr:single-stranded DNA-binding protein [Arachidicoccus sp.]
MIKLQVIGNLGRDCTVNTVNGRTVINFSVAHTEKFKDSNSGETKSRTTWIECAYWTDRTAIAPYLKKGQIVYVEGTPDTRLYQTQDGTSKSSLTLRISNVQLLGSRSSTEEGGTHAASNGTHAPEVAASPDFESNDDLPF